MDLPAGMLERLRAAQRVAVLTGAGISQESGLRTFRDAQAGLWARYRPEDLATPGAFARDPKLVWDWYAMRREKVGQVQPNPGHLALAEMAGLFPEFTLITQNVDGLHARAGSLQVIELHGNIQRVKCAECGRLAERWQDDGSAVPSCLSCGGLLRPDVVWFGESLPAEALEAAVQAARSCQVFFSIGTSGLVQPAASLAYAARNRGALVVEVNAEPTPLSDKADCVLQGRAGQVLPELVRQLRIWANPDT
jgi:NAD-dependent deacetylase